MNHQEKTPAWFRVVAILAIIWNFMGLVAFFMQIKMSEATLSAMSPTDRAIYENTPIWATIGFAIAVFAGTFGSVALLLRKKWAYPVFILSLIGIIMQQTYFFFLSDIMKGAEIPAMIMPAMVLLIGVLLLFFSKKMIRQGWLS